MYTRARLLQGNALWADLCGALNWFSTIHGGPYIVLYSVKRLHTDSSLGWYHKVLPGHRVTAMIAIGAEGRNYSLGRCETSVDCALWRASGTWSLPEESSVICPILGYLDLLSIPSVVKGRDGSVVLWLSGCLA